MTPYKPRFLTPWAYDTLAALGLLAFMILSFWGMAALADLFQYMGWAE